MPRSRGRWTWSSISRRCGPGWACAGIVAELALDELDDVIALTARIKDSSQADHRLVEQAAPSLLALPGAGR